MHHHDFHGRRAIITGAARGIGFAVASRLLALGAKVALWDINQNTLSEASAKLVSIFPEKPSKFITQQVDIANFEAVEKATSDVAQQFGGIEILVNAAGIVGPTAPVMEYSTEMWEQVLSINLNGTFFCCKAALPYLHKTGFGRIVNIASIAGKEGNPNASAYSASKAGVIGFTKSLGKELATTKITANAICPAVIDTEMLKDITEQQIAYMLSKIPMGRMGTVEEIAHLVEFLCSEGCAYSTGAVYDLSGGRATY